jgi:hypothetical protein
MLQEEEREDFVRGGELDVVGEGEGRCCCKKGGRCC